MRDSTSGGSKVVRNPMDLRVFLLRLDPDDIGAWEKYLHIRRRLAKYFEWNICTGPEDLADEVLDRVAAKLNTEEIRDVEKYCFGVARFVCLEAHKKMQRETYSEDLIGGQNALPDGHDQAQEIVGRLYQDRRLACLRRCLAGLLPGDRDLVVQYYNAEEEKAKAVRKKLAESAGLKVGTLRVRTNRLREHLEGCVKRCLESRVRTPKSAL